MKLLRRVQTVIVADDDREVLWALWRTFQGEPYQDLTTDSPEQALRWVRETPVSLVLIDHRMPEMDGIERFEAVADESPRTARVLRTAYPERRALLPGIARRLDGFVTKPWDSTLLRRVIREIFHDRERDAVGDRKRAKPAGTAVRSP